MAERRGQYPQGEADEAASVTAVKEYAHEEPADVTGSFVLHEPPWYGTVCPVVWEDGGSNPASYPMEIMGACRGRACAARGCAMASTGVGQRQPCNCGFAGARRGRTHGLLTNSARIIKSIGL